MRALAVPAAGVVLLVFVAAGAAQELQRLPLVLHVHSDLSTGDRSVEELARMAREQELGGLMLAENFLLRAEYGLAPFRALTRVTHEVPSVLSGGLEKYLERIARARRAHPGTLLLAGVEVIPHYHWSGSPLARTMLVRNIQKNLLVFGVEDPAALRSLPVVGNPHVRAWGWQSLIDAVPVLLVVPGAVLLAVRRRRRHRVGSAIVIVRRRRWALGGALVLIGLLALIRGWPFMVDAYPAWDEHGVAPYQALIDHVDRLGGATIWSLPEAWDEGRRSVTGVTVAWRTDPHPDDLLRTFRYTGFGAVYEAPARFIQPGGGWDRLLVEYAAGERSRAAWAVGESGFHGSAGGKRLGAVQTVFLVNAPTETAVLDALKRGRMYALQRTPESSLVLTDWSVSAGGADALSGGSLRVAAGATVDVRIAVDAKGAGADGLRVALLRNGVVLNGWTGETSVRGTHREVFDGRPAVFRVDARARVPHRLVTNPIFVTPP